MEYASLLESEMCHWFCCSRYMCKKKKKKSACDSRPASLSRPHRTTRNRAISELPSGSKKVSIVCYRLVYTYFYIGEKFCSIFKFYFLPSHDVAIILSSSRDSIASRPLPPVLALHPFLFFTFSPSIQTRKQQMKRMKHERWIWLSLSPFP